MELPPLRFNPILVQKPWGGSRLLARSSNPPDAPVGESWEISDYHSRETRVAEGGLKGLSPGDLMRIYGSAFLGETTPDSQGRFPLLLKLLETSNYVSLQVHPDDVVASQLSDSNGGKEEAWLILDAQPGSRLALGTDTSLGTEEFLSQVAKGKAEDVVNWVEVNRGDFVHIKPGLVHAVEKGIAFMEIQQTSDATYRLYDWSSSERPLHHECAIHAIKPEEKPRVVSISNLPPGTSTELCSTDCLSVTAHSIEGSLRLELLRATIIFVFEGKLELSTPRGTEILTEPDSLLLPASPGSVLLSGSGIAIEMSQTGRSR